MNEQYTDDELEALEEYLEEEFDPQTFYRALTNALHQLNNHVSEAA